ncbi:hypothetical protein GQ42DRAFT_160270 [Ramicandelaber brevisporus]|nr:hypothetical protein GQ42DRAFT_160270 [Ramicandelaber brevisporus]
MPPQQRRTITAISTALDSLRDKIRSFADTADEEQLRGVAQLIDRLSISNNGPFRLLDLPYELLEYTAVRYFTREEAVPILPVNQVFNELFANRVWKSIEFNNMKVDDCEVSPVILMKNFRRIRAVELESIKADFFVSGYFQYATSIVFDLKDEMEMMFMLHLEQMKCLRRVTLTVNDKSDSVIDAAAKWIDNNHRSGHVQQIVIKVAYSQDNRKAVHLMASLMDKIKFKKRIRLDCGSLQIFPASVIPWMPTTLTSLSVARSTPTNCHGEINKQVFGTVPESIFVHLRTLSVRVCCSNSSLYDFQSFVPERFPVLRFLIMSMSKPRCTEDADIPLTTMFSNKQWPSITYLGFVGNGTKVPEVGRLLFKAMPVLQSYLISNIEEFDISPAPDTCLTISNLCLANTTLEMSNLRGKFACLVRLELDQVIIDSNYLQLMASCTRLVEIKLKDCYVTDDAMAAVYSYPCNSVRKVVISKDSIDIFADSIARLLPAFPNIRVLDLTDVPEDKRMNFILKCPPAKFLF